MPSNVRPVFSSYMTTPAGLAPSNHAAVSPGEYRILALTRRVGQRDVPVDDRADAIGDLRKPRRSRPSRRR